MTDEIKQDGLTLLTADTINTPHAFTTRYGGASEGHYDSLNISYGVGDNPEAVTENCRRLQVTSGCGGSLVTTRQTHGTEVYTVKEPKPRVVDADALVTDCTGISLMIFTADCVPVLLHDPVRGVAAAIHAGWRGTVGDIVLKTVDAMTELGSDPGDITAGIGPAISLCCFETGWDVRDAVYAMQDLIADDFVTPAGNDKYYVDLKGINRNRLLYKGVPNSNITMSLECTRCSDHTRFWSHRRDGSARGCQGAIISLK